MATRVSTAALLRRGADSIPAGVMVELAKNSDAVDEIIGRINAKHKEYVEVRTEAETQLKALEAEKATLEQGRRDLGAGLEDLASAKSAAIEEAQAAQDANKRRGQELKQISDDQDVTAVQLTARKDDLDKRERQIEAAETALAEKQDRDAAALEESQKAQAETQRDLDKRAGRINTALSMAKKALSQLE